MTGGIGAVTVGVGSLSQQWASDERMHLAQFFSVSRMLTCCADVTTAQGPGQVPTPGLGFPSLQSCEKGMSFFYK